MYKNKCSDGRNNICGEKIRELRLAMPQKTSQKQIAELLQKEGIHLDKNAVQRIESGQRFITDIELWALSKIFHVSYDELMEHGPH